MPKFHNVNKQVKRLSGIVNNRQLGYANNQRVVNTSDLSDLLDAYLQLKEHVADAVEYPAEK